MAPLSALSPLLLASVAAARQCSNFMIPVDIESRQGLFEKVPVENNLDVSAFATRNNQYGMNYTATLLQDYQTLRGSYEISAQYCTPNNGSNGIVQVLSHGIGFDKTYWDLSYQNYNYSYINTALAAGYSTLAIDRLGIGNSSHGDPFNEIQAQSEIEALNAVTTKLRNGGIEGIETSYNKVIHVGHSFGAVQSYWLSAKYPNNTDGVILTGYSATTMFLPYFVAGSNFHSARLNQPLRFGNVSLEAVRQLVSSTNMSMDAVPVLQSLLSSVGIDLTSQEVWNEVATTEILDFISGYNQTGVQYDYPSGYMASTGLTTLQYLFLYPGMYDVGLAVEGEQTKQPVTVGELLTIGNAPAMSSFTGPVLVMSGEHDVPYCGGNCYAQLAGSNATSIPAGAKMSFPNASAFETIIQPMTGHGLTFHYNATAGFQAIQNFLAANDLATK